MQKVDVTLLFKSFALCGLLLGSMISQVFCEKLAGDSTVIDVDVPKSKEVTFTPTQLADAINDLNLTYAQTNADVAQSLCEGITGDYAPKIESGNLKFYLWKNFDQKKFSDSISKQTYQGLKDTLHFPQMLFNALSNASIVKAISIDDLKDFLRNFQFLDGKFVPISAEASGFKFEKDKFTKHLFISVSEPKLKEFCDKASIAARNDEDNVGTAKKLFSSSLCDSINGNKDTTIVIPYTRFCEIVDEKASFKQTNYTFWGSTYEIDVASSDAAKKELLKGIEKIFIPFIDTNNTLAKEFFSYLSYYQGNSSDTVTNLSNVFEFIHDFGRKEIQNRQKAKNEMFSQRSEPIKSLNEKCKNMKIERVLKTDANDIKSDCKLQTFEHSDVSEEKILQAYLKAVQNQKEFNLTGPTPQEVTKTLLDNLQKVTKEQFKSSLNVPAPSAATGPVVLLTNPKVKSSESTFSTVESPDASPNEKSNKKKWIIISVICAAGVVILFIIGFVWKRKQEDKI